jgi:hypothetical protein
LSSKHLRATGSAAKHSADCGTGAFFDFIRIVLATSDISFSKRADSFVTASSPPKYTTLGLKERDRTLGYRRNRHAAPKRRYQARGVSKYGSLLFSRFLLECACEAVRNEDGDMLNVPEETKSIEKFVEGRERIIE